jgi:phosphodiesterase/alkaline phosphatase D-like protein
VPHVFAEENGMKVSNFSRWNAFTGEVQSSSRFSKLRSLNPQMNKAKFSRRGLLAAAIAAPAGYAAAAEPLWQSKISTAKPFDRPFRMLCAPVLTNPAPDGVTVLWATNAPSTGFVEYGETEKLGQTARGIVEGLAPFVERHMKIRIDGLKPGTKYFYRVHADYTFY